MSINCLLLLILGLSTAALLDAHLFRANDQDGRIVNGKPIDIEDAPYQISLQIKGKHLCGGSIWSNEIIITAAHCLTRFTVDQLLVRAGSKRWKSGGQRVKVSHMKSHENFTEITISNDIAVLRLSKPLKLGRKVQKISLATKTPETGAMAFVSGWGRLQSNAEKIPKYLHGAHIPIFDHETCVSALAKVNLNVTEDEICAGGENKDACQCDSGGPLVSNGELVGVVSWGYNCAQPGFPGVYASVAYFSDWLNAAIKEISNQ